MLFSLNAFRDGRLSYGLCVLALSALSACGDSGDRGTEAVAAKYSVAGSITGLTAAGLVLVNGTDALKVAPGATGFTFPTSLPTGMGYTVTIFAQPQGQTCSLQSSMGKIGASDINTVALTCVPWTFDYEVIYSFQDGPADAQDPQGALIQARDGGLYGSLVTGGAHGHGAIFRWDLHSGTESLLYSFAGAPDGSDPETGVTQGPDGSLYGASYAGGTADAGSLFKIDPQGAETTLHSFDATGNRDPLGELSFDAAGNLYGTTIVKGMFNQTFGTVFEWSASGSFQVLHEFGSDAVPVAGPAGSLLLTSDGSLYGTAFTGGANNGGGVYKLAADGTEIILHVFSGPGDGSTPIVGLTQGSDGNLYGATLRGGAGGFGTFFKITLAGTLTVLHSFDSTDGAGPSSRPILGSDGNFYGVTRSGGVAGFGVVYRMTPDGTATVLHEFAGNSVADGADPNSTLVQASDGNFYGLASSGGMFDHGVIFRLSHH